MPPRDAGVLLVVTALVLGLAGLLLMLAPRLPFLGRLPGDLQFRWGDTTIFIPIVTCLVLSVLVSIGLNLVLRLLSR